MRADGLCVYTVNYRPFKAVELQTEQFRCGKIATTVVLRELGGDTEITLTTTKDWKQVLGAAYLRDQ